MSPGRAVLLIIIVGFIARVLIAATTGLGVDESYMASNARILSLSYVDHPPLHVWIAGLATRLAGSEAPIVLRLPFIVLFAGSTWLLYLLTERLFDQVAGLWAAIAFNIALVFSAAYGTWVLPDGPLIFFLVAAALAVATIVFAEPPVARPTLRWMLAGALAGLAMLSKYSAVFFFAGVFLFLLTVPAARRWLATPGPWLGVLVAALVFAPVIVWNARHGMAGLAFQGGRLARPPAIRISATLVNIAGQAAYLAPWFFLLLVYALGRALRRGRSEPRGWFLALLAIGPIALFTLLSLWIKSLPHWSMPGWLFVFPLAGHELASLAARRPRLVAGLAAGGAAMFLAIVAVSVFQTRTGALTTALATTGEPREPTAWMIDWTDLRAALVERGLLGPNTVVAAREWPVAGKVSYALGADVPVLCLCRNAHHFAVRQDQRSFAGRDVIVVTIAGKPFGLGRYFARTSPLGSVPIIRAGKPAAILDLTLGHDLRFPAAR